MVTGISVSCEVSRGTFISEYFVRIRALDGSLWEGAVDKEMVFDLKREPTSEKYAEGRIYAYLISFDAKSALIELPIEDSTLGRRILVSNNCLRKEEIPA